MSRAQKKLRLVESQPPIEVVETAARSPESFILASAFIVSFSGVAYELLLATYATYLWGGSIYQYSLVFSSMMLAMGLGSWVADHRKVSGWLGNGAGAFLTVESILSIVGAVALPLLYTVYWKGWYPLYFVFGFSVGLGFLVGLEIPFLNRWLHREKRIAELLAVDFAGGFLGGILFPLFLAPRLGLFRVAGLVALLNAFVALWGWTRVKHEIKNPLVPILAAAAFAVGGLFFVQATAWQEAMQKAFFGF